MLSISIVCGAPAFASSLNSIPDALRRGDSFASLRGASFFSSSSPIGHKSSTKVRMRHEQPLAGKTIAITGATGFIGKALLKRLRNEQCNLIVLARSPAKAQQLYPREVFGNIEVVKYDSSLEVSDSSTLKNVLSESDIVVNMAGEDISTGRWTEHRKRELWDSRVVGTRNISTVLQKVGKDDAVFVSMSAIGYYGTSETKTFDETCGPGNDYLAKLSDAWEKAAFSSIPSSSENGDKSIRTVVLRMGVVLGENGGALAKMRPAFELFLGGVPGSGIQNFSWIHVDDAVEIIWTSMGNSSYSGVYNATSPNPVRLKEFCSALGASMGRPSWLPVPSFAIKALVGNEAAQLVLAGQEVFPKRLLKSGYRFKYKNVRDALSSLTKAGVGVM